MKQFGLYARGASRREANTWKVAMWAAWHGAAFERAKRLPKLDTLMSAFDRRPARRPDVKALLEQARKINAAVGGRVRSRANVRSDRRAPG